MARPRKAHHLKVIAGTDQKCRRQPDPPQLPTVDDVPGPPDWLPNAHATKEWQRLAPDLHAAGMLTEASLGLLAHYCAMHGKIVQIHAAGEQPKAYLQAQLRAYAKDLGLMSATQGKKIPNADADTANPYAERPPKPESVKGKARRKGKKTKA